MTDFTVDELKVELKRAFNHKAGDEDLADTIRWTSDNETFKEQPFGLPMVKIESEGGEGEGDYASDTFKVGDRYFTIPGSHQSYDGTYMEFDDMYEVKPVQVTKMEYQAIN